MTEQEFEQRMRAFYKAKADAHWLPDDLDQTVWSIPDDVPTVRGLRSSRAVTVLAAAALLATLLIAGALAIGSGLLRLPWLPDQSDDPLGPLSTVMLTSSPCDQSLPDGVVLDVMANVADGVTPPSQLVLYEDGRTLRGTPDPWSREEWEVRTLSPEGIAELTAAIEQSSLDDCVDVPVVGREMTIRARVAGDVVAMNLGSGWLRVASDTELDAAASLASRLGDGDLGLAAELWRGAAWEPYAHDRWMLTISRFGGNQLGFGAGLQWNVDWTALELPDGSSLPNFGSAMADPLDPRFDEQRCGVVSSAVIEKLRERLGPPLEGVPNQWAFLHPDGDAGGMHVGAVALLPHVRGCERVEPSAPKPPSAQLIPDLRVCDYLDAREGAPAGTVGWRDGWEYADFGGGWAACDYFPGGWVYASRHPISAHQAVAVARHQFGPGVITDRVGGSTIYLNACGGSDRGCAPAVAISAEPHIVIVVPDDHEADLRTLAQAVIERLDR